MEIAQENYLKLIYLEQQGKDHVKPNVIAEKLGVSPAAVTDMVKKLQKDGLVDHSPYKGIRLTVKGQMRGLSMVRRHRIWELYLQKILGYSWDKVHAEAERLEHASSDDLINRLEEVLQFPHFDPHGDPIPSKTGKLPTMASFVPLSALKKGESGRVVRVSDADHQFLQFLDRMGIALNKVVRVKELRTFDQSMLLDIGGKAHGVSHFCAQNIFVEKGVPLASVRKKA